jgi:hypothetical protein
LETAIVKIFVTASRELLEPTVPELALNLLYVFAQAAGEGLQIVHGDARGGDTIARRWAEWMRDQQHEQVTHEPYPAKWSQFGTAAGMIRNRTMVQEHPDADLCLAFPMITSVGTKGMMELCRRAGIPVWECPIRQGYPRLTRPPQARLIPILWTEPARGVADAQPAPPPTTMH